MSRFYTWSIGFTDIHDGCLQSECTSLKFCQQNFTFSQSVQIRKCICTNEDICQLHLNGCFNSNCVHGFFAYSGADFRCICSFCVPITEPSENCEDSAVEYVERLCYVAQLGKHCNINACAIGLCKNGSCVIDSTGYHCDCYPGYTGYNCDTEINECDSSPCINGNCTDKINNYMCECEDGFEGPNCDETDETCHTPCSCEYAKRLEVLSKVNSKPIEELEKEMEQQLLELKQNLTLDPKNLTSQKRKKISAPDDRKSAERIGVVGIIFISVVIGLVIAIDLTSLKTYFDK